MNENVQMHVREYGGLLAGPEKKALLWLARKTPRWINSDHLTLLGLVSMLMAGVSFWAASRNKFALVLAVQVANSSIVAGSAQIMHSITGRADLQVRQLQNIVEQLRKLLAAVPDGSQVLGLRFVQRTV